MIFPYFATLSLHFSFLVLYFTFWLLLLCLFIQIFIFLFTVEYNFIFLHFSSSQHNTNLYFTRCCHYLRAKIDIHILTKSCDHNNKSKDSSPHVNSVNNDKLSSQKFGEKFSLLGRGTTNCLCFDSMYKVHFLFLSLLKLPH